MKANIVYNSVLKDFKSIEERNYAFNNLDAQSQRLEIAWDALQLVLLGKIKAAKGTYWSFELSRIAEKCKDAKELQNVLIEKLPPSCSVCARGNVMLSTIRLGNQLKPKQDCIHKGSKEIVKGFGMLDMFEMEKAYEGWDDDYEEENLYAPKTEERLANILCNVLVNGNFNIEDKTNYLN